jgi:hypothetical protein
MLRVRKTDHRPAPGDLFINRSDRLNGIVRQIRDKIEMLDGASHRTVNVRRDTKSTRVQRQRNEIEKRDVGSVDEQFFGRSDQFIIYANDRLFAEADGVVRQIGR